ncbi:alpha-amylase [Rhizodiscina lignyota]|uniref:Alpha-amylase n=1 Tax=Rhizodiscina lignyota TaxID=1504668 RepID=A0A9P4M548_9PEZI|nr:alpha-amylase [Rhizodiscina lignyota]
MSGIRSINDNAIQSVIQRAPTRGCYPSPLAWEDQVLYFMLPDRFSDGKETGYKDIRGQRVTKGTTPMYTNADNDNAAKDETDAEAWLDAGAKFVGGTLAGLQSKLGYLKRLGVTVIWIGPVFKQVAALQTYHGYGVQNFLDVEPRFGTREQLRHLVQSAHEVGIYVVLDIILNHSADVFAYEAGAPTYNGSVFPVKGFWDENRRPSIPMTDGPIDQRAFPSAFPNAAIWPLELQPQSTFDRKGSIGGDQWDTAPHFSKSSTWAMDRRATSAPRFTSSRSRAARTTSTSSAGNRTFQTVEITGLDAALGIGRVQQTLWKTPKGQCNPNDYFGLFRNAKFLNKGSHAWLRNRVVTMIDDHDQIWRGNDKARFCAFENPAVAPRLVLAAMGMNLCTLGIPCIYYGTEQAFDGAGGGDNKGHGADQFIREAMFGGGFGAFRSKGRHFFDESSFSYLEFAKICEIRRKEEALRRGRQYLRDISYDESGWGLPTIEGDQMKSIMAWSRIFNGIEILCAINTDTENETTVFVTVDHWIKPSGSSMGLIYASGESTNLHQTLTVSNDSGSGRSVVKLAVPPAGFVIYK